MEALRLERACGSPSYNPQLCTSRKTEETRGSIQQVYDVLLHRNRELPHQRRSLVRSIDLDMSWKQRLSVSPSLCAVLAFFAFSVGRFWEDLPSLPNHLEVRQDTLACTTSSTQIVLLGLHADEHLQSWK